MARNSRWPVESASEKQLEILQKLGESLTRLTFRERASELGKLLPVTKLRLNPGPATTALILNQLAEFHLTHKTADRAEELARRSLSILESIPLASRDLSAFAQVADILAHALDARGEFVEAEKKCGIVLAIREDFRGNPLAHLQTNCRNGAFVFFVCIAATTMTNS